MKKIIPLLLLLSLQALHAQKLEKSLLWKISGKGIEKPSYLFGTIHASCDATLDKKTLEALDQTTQLYLEIDMDDPDMQMEMMTEMMMKDGKTMSQMTSKEDFALLDAFLTEQTGFSLQLMNTIKPFFVSAMLIPKILDCEMQSIEMELMKISKEQHEEILGLETISEQMAVFDDIAYQDQMDELVKSVKNNLVNDKKEYQELLALYNSKDLTALLQASEKSDNAMITKYKNELLTNRNKNWIPRIGKIISEKPTFFGVGAAHLGGENGIIMLLRKQGYTVEAVL